MNCQFVILSRLFQDLYSLLLTSTKFTNFYVILSNFFSCNVSFVNYALVVLALSDSNHFWWERCERSSFPSSGSYVIDHWAPKQRTEKNSTKKSLQPHPYEKVNVVVLIIHEPPWVARLFIVSIPNFHLINLEKMVSAVKCDQCEVCICNAKKKRTKNKTKILNMSSDWVNGVQYKILFIEPFQVFFSIPNEDTCKPFKQCK